MAYCTPDDPAPTIVPDELVDEVALLGSPEQVADKLDVWRDAGVTTLILMIRDLDTLRTMPELL